MIENSKYSISINNHKSNCDFTDFMAFQMLIESLTMK